MSMNIYSRPSVVFDTNLLATAGRLLIAALFILSGFSKIGAAEATQNYIASVGLFFPTLLYLATIVVELGGGVLLLIGYRSKLLSIVLAGFTVATALLFHNDLGDPNQMMHFLKNLAITGGLLQIAAFGGGSVSVGARRTDPI